MRATNPILRFVVVAVLGTSIVSVALRLFFTDICDLLPVHAGVVVWGAGMLIAAEDWFQRRSRDAKPKE